MPEERTPLSEIPEIPPENGYEAAPETAEEIKTPEGTAEDFSVDVEETPQFSPAAKVSPINEEEVALHAEELKAHQRPRQVEMLARQALEKGVPHAVAVAKKLDSYSLDALHDTLVDDLYKELRKRGLVKKL